MALFNRELKADAQDNDNSGYPYEESDLPEDDYDDGFDELYEEADQDEELTDEEIEAKKSGRVRLAFGAGNLMAVIGGTVAILLLLTLLFNMIYFVMNDMSRSFSLFQTNF